MVSCVFHMLLLSACQSVGASEQASKEWLTDWMCVWKHGREQARLREAGGGKGSLVLYVGGVFRLGFSKLLHEHLQNLIPFHPHCSQESGALPPLLMVHVVKMLLPCLFSLLLSLLPQPSSFSSSSLLVCPVFAPLPPFSLLCSACLHLDVQLMQRGVLPPTPPTKLCMCGWQN